MSTKDVWDDRPTMAYSFPVSGSFHPHESLTLVFSTKSILRFSIDRWPIKLYPLQGYSPAKPSIQGNDVKSTRSHESPIPSPSLSIWFGL